LVFSPIRERNFPNWYFECWTWASQKTRREQWIWISMTIFYGFPFGRHKKWSEIVCWRLVFWQYRWRGELLEVEEEFLWIFGS
jgi:hypothetical protein